MNRTRKKPELMNRLDVEYWVNLPVQIIEHKIGLPNEADRVYYSLIRCSYCMPHLSAVAVRPQLRNGNFGTWVSRLRDRIAKRRPIEEGAFDEEVTERDTQGSPSPLTQKDLAIMAEMKPPNVSRALKRLRVEGLLMEGFPYYPIPKPKVVPSSVPKDPFVISTDNNSHIPVGHFVINTDKLPSDPEARKKAVQWLLTLNTGYNSGLQKLRTDLRKQFIEGCTGYGILITEDGRLKRVSESEPEADQGSHSPTSKSPEPPTPEQLDEHPVVVTMERLFGKMGRRDPMRMQYARLADEFSIPVSSVCRAINDKYEEKQRKKYTIESAGAMLGFLRSGMPGWIQQHWQEIESDCRMESAKNTPPQDDAEAARQWRAEKEAKLASAETSDEEKRAISRILDIPWQGAPNLPMNDERKPADSEPAAQAQKAGQR